MTQNFCVYFQFDVLCAVSFLDMVDSIVWPAQYCPLCLCRVEGEEIIFAFLLSPGLESSYLHGQTVNCITESFCLLGVRTVLCSLYISVINAYSNLFYVTGVEALIEQIIFTVILCNRCLSGFFVFLNSSQWSSNWSRCKEHQCYNCGTQMGSSHG